MAVEVDGIHATPTRLNQRLLSRSTLYGIHEVDATQVTTADVIKHIARGEPVLIRRALVS